MADFDVEAFITELGGLGMKLTATPLADGRVRVSRWRMMNANEHAAQIRELWIRQIGGDQERIDILAAHLVAKEEAERYISSGLLHVAAPDMATENQAAEQDQGETRATN
jgi:hypothetical protein